MKLIAFNLDFTTKIESTALLAYLCPTFSLCVKHFVILIEINKIVLQHNDVVNKSLLPKNHSQRNVLLYEKL